MPMRRPEVWDFHVHLDPSIGGDPLDGPWWSRQPPAALFALLDDLAVSGITDLDGGWGEDILGDRLDRFNYSDKYVCFGGVAWEQWTRDGHRFGERSAHRLIRQVARGACGLKISKALGLTVVDDAAALVAVEDERLDPIWHAAGKLGVPVLIHVADPPDFFVPAGFGGEHYPAFRSHPEWRIDPARALEPATMFDQFLAVVRRHPGTRFVAAHLGNVGADLDRLFSALEEHDNLSADTSARFEWLGRNTDAARRLLTTYPDRILFGSDYPPSEPLYRALFRLFESGDVFTLGGAYTYTGVPETVEGLNLDADVLKKVYGGNARRMLTPTVRANRPSEDGSTP
jgi:predicted TIM-barrel fold metal-dependent hydrolase